MPITVTDPDGQEHSFPGGTPTASIQTEMQRRVAARTPSQQPAPTPLQRPGMMPPGNQPGPMNAKSASLLDQEMAPLSADAQRGMRMIAGGGATGNRALEMAGRMMVEKDPTYQARKKQSEALGEAAGKRSEMRVAGENILGSYAKLYHAWENTPDEVLAGAMGARNTMPLQERGPTYVPGLSHLGVNVPIPFMDQPTTVDPRTNAPVAGQITPVQRAAILKPTDEAVRAAWNAQNLFNHDVHGLTNAFVTSAPKGMNMSNERQAMFQSAMGDFMKGEGRDAQAKVLDHAKSIIANDFNLTPHEADLVINTHLNRLRQEAANKAKAPPHQIQPGDIRRGYRFKGGDPADQSSWEKATP